MKKITKQILAVILVIMVLLSIIPFNTFAAPAADIPLDMLDNVYLDALEYSGYDVSSQKSSGTIFKTYGSSVSSSIRSDIGYGSSATGLETVTDNGTVSGNAPNISHFENEGLCCASYVTYVYYNYMPNIAGIDTSICSAPGNTKLARSYNDTAVAWVNAGKAREITFTQNSNGNNFVPAEEIPIGSLIVFQQISGGRISHVAIYAGQYNGNYFVTHVGNERGPEISTIVGMSKGDTPQVVTRIVTPQFIEQNGKIEVYKKDTEGKSLLGACFVATSNSNSSLKFEIGPTDSNGYACVEGIPFGTYSVKETVFPTNYQSSGNSEWTVTIDSGTPNATVTINAVNELIPGDCKIVKTSEDGNVDGIKFSIIGNGVNQTVTTSNGGQVTVKNLKPGTYTVTEEKIEKYVPQDSKTITVVSNQTATVTFNNVLKKWRVQVTKIDSEYSIQGDASLEGAVYGLYNGDVLVKTYTTDNNGNFTTDYYVCGSEWNIREITPSQGYLLDETVYDVEASPQNYTVELNTEFLEVKEQVIKGSILIAKHSDSKIDGANFDTPEQGAEFEVYLKSAGGFENAKETERDLIVTDKDGYATTKNLPYGVYTVKQVKGAAGMDIMKPFDVQINKDGEVYKYMINNAVFQALIEIVKKDAESGMTIPVAGIGFKIRNRMTGEYITQHINYPTPTDLDVFYTNESGMLMLPEMLPYGQYEIIEQCTAEGYVLDKSPVQFTVDGSKEIVTVTIKNKAQKGVINISKTGEVFSSVSQYNGLYKPFYTVEFLEGAVFEITAAEDIVTPDGTLRYKKGDVVDTVTTSLDGKAESIPLYLGEYSVKEVKAPDGMVIDSETKTIELTYAGQEIEVTQTECSFFNERQKLKITLKKELEKDFGLGAEQYKNVYFALYAEEEIMAADGTIIPTDGLIEIAQCDKDGNIIFKADLPIDSKAYIREYATDNHYIISDKIYHIGFEYKGQDIKEVVVNLNDGEAIKNELIRGTVKIKKKDNDGNALAGVTFGLFNVGETEFTKDKALLISVSGADGMLSFDNVPFGIWLIREIETVSGYEMNNETFEVNIDWDGCIVELTVINNKVPKSPQTGDNSKPWIPIIAMLLSAISFVGLSIKFKKRKEN